VIFAVSAIMFVVGAALVLRSLIAISYDLIKLAALLVAWCGCALAVVVMGCLLFVQWYVKHVAILVRWFRGLPEPETTIVININIVDSDEDADDIAHTIELPRQAFRRLR
jgi:hypothetical protein